MTFVHFEVDPDSKRTWKLNIFTIPETFFFYRFFSTFPYTKNEDFFVRFFTRFSIEIQSLFESFDAISNEKHFFVRLQYILI